MLALTKREIEARAKYCGMLPHQIAEGCCVKEGRHRCSSSSHTLLSCTGSLASAIACSRASTSSHASSAAPPQPPCPLARRALAGTDAQRWRARIPPALPEPRTATPTARGASAGGAQCTSAEHSPGGSGGCAPEGAAQRAARRCVWGTDSTHITPVAAAQRGHARGHRSAGSSIPPVPVAHSRYVPGQSRDARGVIPKRPAPPPPCRAPCPCR